MWDSRCDGSHKDSGMKKTRKMYLDWLENTSKIMGNRCETETQPQQEDKSVCVHVCPNIPYFSSVRRWYVFLASITYK